MRLKLSYTTISRLILLSIILLMVAGCIQGKKATREEKMEVRKIMELRQQAIQTKDIALYKQLIFPGYNDGGVNYDAIIADMQEKFDRFEKIEFTFQRSTVDMDMNSARMVGQVSYKAAGMERPVYDQEITIFRRVDGKWMISGGVRAGLF